jgi:hypothetical protein
MKRSFRVATAFTGATACAVALAPVGAQEAHAASIRAGDCSKGFAKSALHLYYEHSEDHPEPACFSLDGSVYLGTGKRFASYCGGGWSGYLWIKGTAHRFTAGATYHHLYGQSVSRVLISRYPYSVDCS